MTCIPQWNVGAVNSRGHPAPKGPPSPHTLLALSQHSISNSQMFVAKSTGLHCTPEQRESLHLGGFAI